MEDNFHVRDWELSDDDKEAISSLETQNKNVPAAMFLKEGGPYVTESDVRHPATPDPAPAPAHALPCCHAADFPTCCLT